MLFRKRDRPGFPETRHRYFGYKDGLLRGAVYCERVPEQKFTVELCDRFGNAISRALADHDFTKGDIPSGYGFEIPVPIEWVASPEPSIRVQFRVLETGKVFPSEPGSVQVDSLRQLYRLLASRPVSTGHVLDILECIPKPDPEKRYIIVCIHEMTRTGAPLIALEIVRVLKERHGFDSVVLSVDRNGALEEDFKSASHAVIDGLNEPTLNSGIDEKLTETLRAYQPQAILMNSIRAAPLAEFVQKFPVPRAGLIHEYPLGYSDSYVQGCFSACDTVIFPADDVRNAYSRRGLTEKSNPRASFNVIPQGCYMLRRQKLSPVSVEASRVDLPPEITENGILILGCGSVNLRKGFDWFCQLLVAYCRHSLKAGDMKFAWIGNIEDQSLFEYAMHDLETAGVLDRFVHIDEVADVGGILDRATTFVLSSRSDPFPSVVQEALLHGLPVIGFDCGQGTSSMIANESLGKIIPYLDIMAGVEALDRCISDSSFRERVRKKGPQLVHEQLSFETYVDSIMGALIPGET